MVLLWNWLLFLLLFLILFQISIIKEREYKLSCIWSIYMCKYNKNKTWATPRKVNVLAIWIIFLKTSATKWKPFIFSETNLIGVYSGREDHKRTVTFFMQKTKNIEDKNRFTLISYSIYDIYNYCFYSKVNLRQIFQE